MAKTPARGGCPPCGGGPIVAVHGEVVLRVRSVRHRFADVSYERCTSCGERFYDYATSQRFDAAVLAGRGKRPAA